MAYNIDRYHQITQNTVAIAFLGTPHRGADLSDLADTLKILLNITFSESRFVKDLLPDSQSIKEINDAFADRSTGLQLASFYESIGKAFSQVFILCHPLFLIVTRLPYPRFRRL
jgi:hypothetical protein